MGYLTNSGKGRVPLDRHLLPPTRSHAGSRSGEEVEDIEEKREKGRTRGWEGIQCRQKKSACVCEGGREGRCCVFVACPPFPLAVFGGFEPQHQDVKKYRNWMFFYILSFYPKIEKISFVSA